MKKLIYLLALILSIVACEKDEVPDRGQLNPDAMILIRPAVQTKSFIPGLSGIEVVEQALNIKWQTHYTSNTYNEEVVNVGRSFTEQQKDYDIPALLMFGIDVITQEGDYLKDLTHAFNVVITTATDTIAYIPDSVINNARPLIEQAYENENYTEVYRIFDEAFTFSPIPQE